MTELEGMTSAAITQQRLAIEAVVKLAGQHPPFSTVKAELTAVAEEQRAALKRLEEAVR